MVSNRNNVVSSRPLISTVIPLYNKEKTIARAIRSVFTQDRRPDALILVDDGSTDTSAGISRAVLSEAPQDISCKLLLQPNAGVSVARNVGAEAIPSDYIAFLDADDEWLPLHLAEIDRLAQTCSGVGLLSTRYARLDKNGVPVPEPSALPTAFFGEVTNGLAAYRMGYGILHTSTIVVGRGAWTRSGGFPPGARKSQDIHLWLRLLLKERFAHSDQCTGIWHEEDTGVDRRSGAVPCHFSYFLGTKEGRQYLSNPDLMAFLQDNLASHVAGHRIRRDDDVVRELLLLSKVLPLKGQLKARAIATLPAVVLQMVAQRRQRLRQKYGKR